MMPKEIKQYALELFCELNLDGSQVNSFRDISEKIQQKFNKTVGFSNISLWAIKYKWNEILEKIKIESINKLTEKQEEIKSQFVDKKANEISMILKNYASIEIIAFKRIFEIFETYPDSIDAKTAMQMCKMSRDTIFRFQSIPTFEQLEKQNEEKIVQKFYVLNPDCIDEIKRLIET